MTTVYLNGKFLPIEKAFVPVLDRGFIFGDGAYEVIPVYSRHPFHLHEHLLRLQRSLDSIRLKNPHTVAEWSQLIKELLSNYQEQDLSIYLHITRGVAKRDHAFPENVTPTVFMMSSPLLTPSQELRDRGVSVITAQDNRWLRCDIKSIALLPNVLLRQLAVDTGAVETILLRDGFLTEGSASNVFVVRNGTVLAPPKNELILPGVTYDVVIELATSSSIPLEIRPISEAEFRAADELWLTSSTKEVLPITLLDNAPVGGGRPGAMFKRIYQLYQEHKNQVMRLGNS